MQEIMTSKEVARASKFSLSTAYADQGTCPAPELATVALLDKDALLRC